VYLASIGRINKESNNAMAATLTELMGKHFGIKAGRIFIQFVDAEAVNFGWNGRTFG
jgi:phenylpyruvate tautomerase PptA (4-oxalocrotonate tautomerase family)